MKRNVNQSIEGFLFKQQIHSSMDICAPANRPMKDQKRRSVCKQLTGGASRTKGRPRRPHFFAAALSADQMRTGLREVPRHWLQSSVLKFIRALPTSATM